MRKGSIIIFNFYNTSRFHYYRSFCIYILCWDVSIINKSNRFTTCKDFDWGSFFMKFFHFASRYLSSFGTIAHLP